MKNSLHGEPGDEDKEEGRRKKEEGRRKKEECWHV
jgi:hypothetical protein